MNSKHVFVIVTVLVGSTALSFAQYYAPPNNTSSMAAPRIGIDQLPATAQTTVRREAAGRKIATITRETYSGQPGYRVQFEESGRNPVVIVADNGDILRPEEKPPALGVGTTFEKAPPAVQSTIKEAVGTGEITIIDQEGHRSERRYRVDAKDAQGVAFQLEIARDGKVLLDTRQAGKPTGR